MTLNRRETPAHVICPKCGHNFDTRKKSVVVCSKCHYRFCHVCDKPDEKVLGSKCIIVTDGGEKVIEFGRDRVLGEVGQDDKQQQATAEDQEYNTGTSQ